MNLGGPLKFSSKLNKNEPCIASLSTANSKCTQNSSSWTSKSINYHQRCKWNRFPSPKGIRLLHIKKQERNKALENGSIPWQHDLSALLSLWILIIGKEKLLSHLLRFPGIDPCSTQLHVARCKMLTLFSMDLLIKFNMHVGLSVQATRNHSFSQTTLFWSKRNWQMKEHINVEPWQVVFA